MIPSEGSSSAIAVAAVSDGHGGARHFRSQIGSSLAVNIAVDVLQGFVSSRTPRADAPRIDARQIQAPRIEAVERMIVQNWLAAVSSDLENHPLTEEELSQLEREEGVGSRRTVETFPALAYGATLLAAAATENLVVYLQLGDGEILIVSSRGETTRPLPADTRLVANQTTSLCQPDAWREFRAAWFSDQGMPALVLLSTDGYSNSFRSDKEFLQTGSDYLAMIREQGIDALAEELPEILTEATEQGSGDDITVAILVRELSRGAGEATGNASDSSGPKQQSGYGEIVRSTGGGATSEPDR
jgi:serine/threonine protein phosphatase PrpC